MRKKTRLKIRLKKLPEDGEYIRGWCCAAGCKKLSEVVEGTKKRSPNDLPLCIDHWDKLTDDWQ